VPVPFFEDFPDHALEESQFFFTENKASALDHFAPITFPIYFVEIELHDRSKRCANFARPTRIDSLSLRTP
jgi:hypothetical protein